MMNAVFWERARNQREQVAADRVHSHRRENLKSYIM
jgi:hypothetical protein